MHASAPLRIALSFLIASSAALGVVCFTARALASPPPTPRPIKIKVNTLPAANLLPNHVVRMKLWHNDVLFYEGTSPHLKDFPEVVTSFAVLPGGTLKTELTLFDTSGRQVAQDTKTRTNLFNKETGWVGGQVFIKDPTKNNWHAWLNHTNEEVRGYMCLYFHVEHKLN